MKALTFTILFIFFGFFTNAQNNITWEPLYEPGSGGRMTGIAISPHNGNHVIVTGDMLGVGVSFDGGDTWNSTFGLVSYECAQPTFHPVDSNIVWLATLSGPYISYDKGINWTIKRNGMGDFGGWYYSHPVERILIDPKNPDHLLAFEGNQRHWGGAGSSSTNWGGVWESYNNGDKWVSKSVVDDNFRNKKYGVVAACYGGTSSDTIYAAVDKSGAYASYDGGNTWNYLFDGIVNKNIRHIEAHPSNSKIVYTSTTNHQNASGNRVPGAIYKSVDAGQTWTKIINGLPQNIGNSADNTAKYQTIRVAASNPDVLFTSNTSWSDAGIYISKYAGESWEEVATETLDKAYPAGKSLEIATINPNDENNIMCAGASYILRTYNLGETWDDATSWHPLGNEEWRGRGYSGLVSQDFKFHPTNENISALAAMDAGNFWISKNKHYTWKKGGAALPTWGGGNSIAFAGKSTVYVALGQADFKGIAKSTNLGESFIVLHGAARGLPNEGSSGKAESIFAFSQDPNNVWAVIGEKLYFSENGGNNWKIIFSDADVFHIDGVNQSNSEIIIGTSDGVYRGINNEFTLYAQTLFNVTFCKVDPSDSTLVYACGWREDAGGLWRYKNSQWEKVINDMYVSSVDINPGNSNDIIAGTSDHPYHDKTFAKGVYLSRDGGDTWTLENTGLAMVRGGGGVAFNPHNPLEIIYGTGGRGYFKGTWETELEPKVEIINPSNQTEAIVNDSILIQWKAFYAQKGVEKFDVFINNEHVKELPGDAESYNWIPSEQGLYNIYATATDSLGNDISSQTVKVTVLPSEKPEVTITSPLSGTSFDFNSSLEITVDASDPDGTITKVEFYNDSIKLGEDTESPFSFMWENVPEGSHYIIVQATDNTDQTVASSPVNITVDEEKYSNYYVEDFNDGIAQEWEATSGEWNVEDLMFRNTTTEDVENSIYNGHIFGEYMFSVKANPDKSRYFGLLFNYQDAENYYLLMVSVYPKLVIIREVKDGVATTIEQQNYSGGGTGIWMDLKLTNEDGLTTVQINDNTVLNEVSTPEFTSGRIGLYTGKNSLWFDDVNVSAKQMEDFIKVSAIAHQESGIEVYPNPIIGDIFYVNCDAFGSTSELKIYDISGKVILKKNMDKNTRAISTKNFYKSGLYIIEVVNGKDILKEKIMLNILN